MKRLLFIGLLAVFCSSMAIAQTTVQISGQVTELGTGLPIENQQVIIMTDSSSPGGSPYYNMVFTNANGAFSDVAVIPANVPLLFIIGTYDCNWIWHQQTALSTSSPIFVSFSICQTGPPPPCNAMFYAVPDSANPAGGTLSWQFFDVSSGNPFSWAWNFGDGSTSTLQHPYHTYAQAGTYTVTLTISAANNCQSTYTLTLVAGNAPNCWAQFVYLQNGTTTANFQSLSSPDAITWFWDFGDSTSSSLENPQHTYAQAGNYWVCLTITTPDTCTSTFCDLVMIGGAPPACNAMFHAIPDSANPAGGTLSWQFFDVSSGNPFSWAWNFGDGSTSTLQHPYHTYAQAGTYTVTLTISAANNCLSTYTLNLVAGNAPNCWAQFAYLQNGTTTVNFQNLSSPDAITWFWDFGDNTSSSLENPQHTYAQAGNYWVCLTITTPDTCTSTFCDLVTIGGVPCFPVHGRIFAGNTPLDAGFAVLYLMDSLSGNQMVVDSALVDSAGYYFFCPSYNLPYEVYVKAFPTANSLFYSTHAPTYYTSSLFWTGADPIYPSPVGGPYEIYLQGLNPPFAGPGNISGTITQGNKLMGNGLPVPNIEILLLDVNDNPLAVRYSDNAGQFTFTSLPYNTYKIHAEVSLIPTTPAFVTLSSANPSSNNLSLLYNNSGIFTAINDPINGKEGYAILKLYPNPANEAFSLRIRSEKQQTLSVRVLDLTGKVALEQLIHLSAGTLDYPFDTRHLSPGMYSLSVTAPGKPTTNHKLSITR